MRPLRQVVIGMEGLKKTHQRGCLSWRKRTAIRRHVSAAQQHLPVELIFCQASRHFIQRRPALAAAPTKLMAVAALLLLQNVRSLPLQRRATLQQFWRHLRATPRIHLRTPRRIRAQIREYSPTHRDKHHRDHRNRSSPPALLPYSGNKRQSQQHRHATTGAIRMNGVSISGGKNDSTV